MPEDIRSGSHIELQQQAAVHTAEFPASGVEMEEALPLDQLASMLAVDWDM